MCYHFDYSSKYDQPYVSIFISMKIVFNLKFFILYRFVLMWIIFNIYIYLFIIFDCSLQLVMVVYKASNRNQNHIYLFITTNIFTEELDERNQLEKTLVAGNLMEKKKQYLMLMEKVLLAKFTILFLSKAEKLIGKWKNIDC